MHFFNVGVIFTYYIIFAKWCKGGTHFGFRSAEMPYRYHMRKEKLIAMVRDLEIDFSITIQAAVEFGHYKMFAISEIKQFLFFFINRLDKYSVKWLKTSRILFSVADPNEMVNNCTKKFLIYRKQNRKFVPPSSMIPFLQVLESCDGLENHVLLNDEELHQSLNRSLTSNDERWNIWIQSNILSVPHNQLKIESR